MEENQNASGESQVVGSAETSDDVVKYSTYRKVLGEKKRQDEKVANLQSQVDELLDAKLKADGDKDARIETLQKRYDELKESYDSERATRAEHSVNDQLKRVAVEAGCKDTEAFLRFVDSKDLEGLEYLDGNYTIEKDGLNRLVEDVKKRTESLSLFKNPSVNFNDVVPKRQDFEEPEKPLKELSDDEFNARIDALEKEANQAR